MGRLGRVKQAQCHPRKQGISWRLEFGVVEKLRGSLGLPGRPVVIVKDVMTPHVVSVTLDEVKR